MVEGASSSRGLEGGGGIAVSNLAGDKHGVPEGNARFLVRLLIWSLCDYHHGIWFGHIGVYGQDTEWGLFGGCGGAFPFSPGLTPQYGYPYILSVGIRS